MMKRASNYSRSLLLLLAALLTNFAMVDVALAARGQIGGLAGISGCVKGCFNDSKDTGVTEHECLRYCECALTIESTRWQEEMQASRVEQRSRMCASRVWPSKVPPAYGSKRVLICVPQPFKDEREKNSPEVMKLYKDGIMAKHFALVDQELTELKADKQSRLYKAVANGRKSVVIFLDDHRAPTKVREVRNDMDCPPRHWINDYDFEEWIQVPGRKLP